MPKKSVKAYRTPLFILTFLLCALGLFFVFEASTAESFSTYDSSLSFCSTSSYLVRCGSGWVNYCFFVPIHLWQKFSPILYIVSLILLALVFIPGLGLELNGAKRWIDLGPVTFQPIEFAKLALIIFFLFMDRTASKVRPIHFFNILPSVLLLLQPDMGSLLILLTISFSLFLLSWWKLKKALAFWGWSNFLLLVAVFPLPIA